MLASVFSASAQLSARHVARAFNLVNKFILSNLNLYCNLINDLLFVIYNFKFIQYSIGTMLRQYRSAMVAGILSAHSKVLNEIQCECRVSTPD
jgi:hypothetical protein